MQLQQGKHGKGAHAVRFAIAELRVRLVLAGQVALAPPPVCGKPAPGDKLIIRFSADPPQILGRSAAEPSQARSPHGPRT